MLLRSRQFDSMSFPKSIISRRDDLENHMTQKQIDHEYNRTFYQFRCQLLRDQDRDLCIRAVKFYPYFISYVNSEFLDFELLKLAVKTKFLVMPYQYTSLTPLQLIELIQNHTKITPERKDELIGQIGQIIQ